MDKWASSQMILSIVGILVVISILLIFFASKASPYALVFELVLAGGFLVLAMYSIRKKWDWFLWSFSIAAIVVISTGVSWAYWKVLHSNQDSVSTTARNLGLLTGGAIAILVAVWRSKVAESQSETAQNSLLNERYQTGAEMLGSDVLAVRLGGIYALQRIAREDNPEQYHVQIMNAVLSVRSQSQEADEAKARRPELEGRREDVQAVHGRYREPVG